MEWLEHLPWVLLGIRVAPKEDSGVSAAEAGFGGQLALPGQFLDPAGAESLPLSKAAQDNGWASLFGSALMQERLAAGLRC